MNPTHTAILNLGDDEWINSLEGEEYEIHKDMIPLNGEKIEIEIYYLEKDGEALVCFESSAGTEELGIESFTNIEPIRNNG